MNSQVILTMQEDSVPIRGKHHFILAVVFGLLTFTWMFSLGDHLLDTFLVPKWQSLFGTSIFDAPEVVAMTVAGSFFMVPFIILFLITMLFGRHFYALNFTAIHESNIKDLEKAKHALQQGILSIDAIEKEYRGKLQTYEQLNAQLDELQSVRNIDVEDLRKKLNAVSIANSRSVWWDRFMGFIVGLLSSLASTYIWNIFK